MKQMSKEYMILRGNAYRITEIRPTARKALNFYSAVIVLAAGFTLMLFCGLIAFWGTLAARPIGQGFATSLVILIVAFLVHRTVETSERNRIRKNRDNWDERMRQAFWEKDHNQN